MRLIGILLAVAVLVGGGWYMLRPQKLHLGKAGETGVSVMSTTDAAKAALGTQVAVQGTISKECPTAGCWAVIKDAAGDLRVDTKKGGFTFPLRHEGSHVRVVGLLEKNASGVTQISLSSAEMW